MELQQSHIDELSALCQSLAPPHHESDSAPEEWIALSLWSANHTLGLDSLPVSGEACEQTIFGDKQINMAFRAWHDAVHIKYGLGFTYEDEYLVSLFQQSQAIKLGASTKTCQLIDCEVWGQARYHEIHGRFIDDQQAFTAAYLSNPAEALTNPNW